MSTILNYEEEKAKLVTQLEDIRDRPNRFEGRGKGARDPLGLGSSPYLQLITRFLLPLLRSAADLSSRRCCYVSQHYPDQPASGWEFSRLVSRVDLCTLWVRTPFQLSRAFAPTLTGHFSPLLWPMRKHAPHAISTGRRAIAR